MSIENCGIPRCIRLDQAKCFVGHQANFLCNKNKRINLFKDHLAIGLVQRVIQTINNRLVCIREEKLVTNSFYIKHARKIIIHQLRICKQKTTKISPFEAHFCRKRNTPLSVNLYYT